MGQINMSRPKAQSNPPPLQFTLKRLICLVVMLSVCCALIPGAAMFVIGAMPLVIGFLIVVSGDQRHSDVLVIIGSFVMAIGLGIGAALMAIVRNLG